MPAVKSGNNIVIPADSGILTLAQLTSDIADTNYIESMGSGVYRIKCTVARILYIYGDAGLEIGTGETLEIYSNLSASTNYFRLITYGRLATDDVEAKFIMKPGSTFEGRTSDSTANNYGVEWLLSGSNEIIGESDNRVVINNIRQVQLPYASGGNNTVRFLTGDSTFQYIEMHYLRTTPTFVIQPYLRSGKIWFDNIIFYNDDGTVRTYCFMTTTECVDYLKISNISTAGSWASNTGFYFLTGATAGLIENVTFEQDKWYGNTYPMSISYAVGQRPKFNTPYGAIIPARKDTNQVMMIFRNCTFYPQNNYVYYGYLYANAVVLLDSVTFSGSVKTFVVYNKAKLMLYNTDWITSSVTADNDGVIVKVYKLILTVKDTNGNNLEDVYIRAKQKDGYEDYYWYTKSNGKIDGIQDYECGFLGNEIRYYNNQSLKISDDSNSSYHTITVMKEGYKTETFNIVMDEDKEVTVQLRPLTKMYLGTTELTGVGIG